MMKKVFEQQERIHYDRLLVLLDEEINLKHALEFVQLKLGTLVKEIRNLRNAKDKLQR